MKTISTQYESPEFISTSRKTKNTTSKQDSVVRPLLFYDFMDLDDPMDLDRLKLWCQSTWLTTIRKALLYRNLIQYHVCCNSFSRRNFCRGADHPTEKTFELHRLPVFRTIETGEDLFRWLVATARDNAKHGQRTLFPTINFRHVELGTLDKRSEDDETVCMLRKRCQELEKELDHQKHMLRDVEADNSRLLWSSKMWHAKYEELLDQKDPPLDIYSTPIKSKLNNVFMFQNS